MKAYKPKVNFTGEVDYEVVDVDASSPLPANHYPSFEALRGEWLVRAGSLYDQALTAQENAMMRINQVTMLKEREENLPTPQLG